MPRVYGKGNIKEIAIDERLRLGWRRCRGQACKHGGQQRGWQGPDRNGRREGPPCQENGADTQLQSPCQHTSKVSSHLGNQPVPGQFPRSMPAVTGLHARGPASCRACSCPGLEGDSREEGSLPRRVSCPVVSTHDADQTSAATHRANRLSHPSTCTQPSQYTSLMVFPPCCCRSGPHNHPSTDGRRCLRTRGRTAMQTAPTTTGYIPPSIQRPDTHTPPTFTSSSLAFPRSPPCLPSRTDGAPLSASFHAVVAPVCAAFSSGTPT